MSEKEKIRIRLYGQPSEDPESQNREQEFWLDIMEKRIMEALQQTSDEELTLHMLREHLRYPEC